MHILVYGIGVIGSIYATRFVKAGFSVTVLARGERLKAVREKGLKIRNVFNNEEEESKVGIIENISSGSCYDFILVAVRAGQIDSVLTGITGSGYSAPVVVIGNNLGNFEIQEKLIGKKNFVLGFGAFGGYREDGVIAYTDGRTKEKQRIRSNTKLGVLHQDARVSLGIVQQALLSAGLPCSECMDMRSWLICHAALVFPLAGTIFASGGDQARTCRTRDSIVLGIRACKELFRALRLIGYKIEPKNLKRLLAMPEWLLTGIIAKSFAGEGARVAMFGHANAAGGRNEICKQAIVLDGIVKTSGMKFISWQKLLPYFDENPGVPLLPDGSKTIRLHIW